MAEVIEVYEGHDVTTAAISVNIGSGLLEAMKIDPHSYRGGEIVDAVVRFRIKRVSHEPVIKDDYEGPWKRIHVGVPLAAVPTSNTAVSKIIEAHLAKVSKFRELPGQRSIDDEIVGVTDIGTKRTAKRQAKKAAAKRHPSKKKDDAPVDLPPPPIDTEADTTGDEW